MKRRFSSAVFAAITLSVFAAVGAEMKPLTDEEKLSFDYRCGERFSLGKENWKIAPGKIAAAAEPGFDDSSWHVGQVECPLAAQGFVEKKFHTFRKTFTLPDGWEKSDLLLDLGYISVTDEAWINGVKVGNYGTFPEPIYGSSWVPRHYWIPAAKKAFRPGVNTLTVFVYPGTQGGMYSGIPSLSKAQGGCAPSFRIKTPGAEALAFNLSDAAHLNRYRPGAPLNLEMSLSQITGGSIGGAVSAEIVGQDGKVVSRGVPDRVRGELRDGMKTVFDAVKFTAPRECGDYTLRMRFTADDGRVVWSQEAPVAVTGPVKFTLPVDRALENRPQRYNVSKDSVGHFGPHFQKDGKLVDNFKKADTRGALAFSVRPMPNAPLILMCNVRPSPGVMPKPHMLLAAKGNRYDGFPDAWIFGTIRPAASGKLVDIGASGDWGEKEFRYRFEKEEMKLVLSAVHPAFRVGTKAKKLCVFDMAKHYGTNLPTRAAGVVDGKVIVGKADKRFPVAGLSENWLLVWFSGNPAYKEFDVPWLFVFRHKLRGMDATGALIFDFGPRGVGEMLGMPLYGVTLQRPAETAKWDKNLPDDVVTACRRWSRILAAAPGTPERTFTVDFANDRLTVHDKFTHRLLRDDWNTRAEKIAPVYPLLPLTLATGAISGALHAPARDLEYATLHGPLHAVPGDSVTMQFRDILHFVSEVREVRQAADSPAKKRLLARLDALLQASLAELREKPFFPKMIWNEKFVVGKLECGFSDLLDALRYADEKTAAALRSELIKTAEPWLLYDGMIPEKFHPLLKKIVRNRTALALVTSPTGKELLTYRPNETDYAIDSCCWEALRLYAIWDYARICDRRQYVRDNWTRIKQFYNLIPNSHAWPLGISFDSYAGLRVGNGLQETGIMHAGMCAAARMAYDLGDIETRDRAAYYASMQLCGLVGAMSANQYLRDHRPTVAGSTRDADVQFCEYQRAIHYAEFNENGGMSQNVINPPRCLNSISSYIMTQLPEIMRPYKDVYPAQTEDFFMPKFMTSANLRGQGPVTPKIRVYMLRNYPQTALELLQTQIAPRGDLWRQSANFCAALDSLGEISYRKLWEK